MNPQLSALFLALFTVFSVRGDPSPSVTSEDVEKRATFPGVDLDLGLGFGLGFGRTDVRNCGAVGKVCPSDPNGQSVCTLGVCRIQCKPVYGFNGSKCIPTASDVSNCGKVGNVCYSSITHGSARCIQGSCSATCDALYAWSPQLSNCISVLSVDPRNCGSVGNVCSAANAVSGCLDGKCVSTCNFGYAKNSAGVCQAISDDSKNCLSLGVGFIFNIELNACISIFQDPRNCGGIGINCPSPDKGFATCSNSQCSFSCDVGYTKSGVSCVLSASVAVKPQRRAFMDSEKLCPVGEDACPIIPSSVLVRSVKQRSELMSGGGYECLDTTSALESCGGCASTGAGKDCTTIKNALGVGCQAGSCLVFSCEPGYRPSDNAKHCVRGNRDTRGRVRLH